MFVVVGSGRLLGFSPYLQIEYTLVTLDHEKKRAKLSLLGPQILQGLQQPESSDPFHHKSKWRPEYASYMIEGRYYFFNRDVSFIKRCPMITVDPLISEPVCLNF